MIKGMGCGTASTPSTLLEAKMSDSIMGAYRASAVHGAAASLHTAYGAFRIIAYRDVPTGKEHAALVMGEVEGAEDVITRVHSECLTGDVFQSCRCDCGPQLQAALRAISAAGKGVLLYLRQEGRGIGLIEKIAAYELQEQGLDTAEANLELGHPVDARTYEAASDILRDIGVKSIQLLTNNPDKVSALNELGVEITKRLPIEIPPQDQNRDYLETKKKMGHFLDQV
jgi:3,4-dihydroxy 2-butanone 4-phosphate synthase / GTP cyclohydrolase II